MLSLTVEASVTGLMTDHLVEPGHIGPTPSFSWRMDVPRTGAWQTAYRIQVRYVAHGRSEEPTVWDSGEVVDRCKAK